MKIRSVFLFRGGISIYKPNRWHILVFKNRYRIVDDCARVVSPLTMFTNFPVQRFNDVKRPRTLLQPRTAARRSTLDFIRLFGPDFSFPSQLFNDQWLWNNLLAMCDRGSSLLRGRSWTGELDEGYKGPAGCSERCSSGKDKSEKDVPV